MKLYDETEEDQESGPEESPNGHSERTDYAKLFDAPDYATFIKTNVTNQSKLYERKVASLVKAGIVGSINVQNYPDAAALLKYGPPFCRAAGELASVDARTRSLIDMGTTPSNPYALFVAATLPLLGQMIRNHQPQVEQIGLTWRQRRAQKRAAKRAGLTIPKQESQPIGHIKIGKRSIPIRVGVKLPRILKAFNPLSMMTAQTSHPNALVNEVFSDPKVIEALRKMGARPEREPEQQATFDDLDGDDEFNDDEGERM